MKTKLQQELARIAPYISISTYWEHDNNCGTISKECCGFDESEDDEWQAWKSNICCTAIVEGREFEGNAYLGGTWGKAGDDPSVSNPDISGYEAQMTAEALEELHSKTEDETIQKQADAAIEMCKAFMALSYEEQRKQLQAA